MKPFSHEQVLPFRQARKIVEDYAGHLRPTSSEKISLGRALARFLAEPLHADRDFPPFARATRDGYAVRSADLAKIPAQLKIIGEIKAGTELELMARRLSPGEAFAIMTGAPVPVEADAVLMQEHTRNGNDGTIAALRPVAAGENIVPRGSEAVENQLLFDTGTRLTPTCIAVAASAGYSTVTVYRRPQVAVLTTGDEIVPIHAFPRPTQIRNSNLYSLAAQIELAGGEPVPLPIAPDNPRKLRDSISAALRHDLALFSGGVSMGKYDLVEDVLKELKANFYFTGALIQPGRPTVFGEVNLPSQRQQKHSTEREAAKTRRVPFFGLPGNPVSTIVTFELFVTPVLRALARSRPAPLLFVLARMKNELRTPIGLTRFLPARLSGEPGNVEVEYLNWRGSGDIICTSHANCYLVVSDDREQLAAGEMVSVLIPGAELR